MRIFRGVAVVTACCLNLYANAGVVMVGDPTVNLTNSLFLDAASLSGGDTNPFSAAQVTLRNLDLNLGVGAPSTPGILTLSGFGFTIGGNLTSPATSFTLGFTYLGADQVFGGVDDVVIGTTEALSFSYVLAATEYYVNFVNSPSALIDGLGEAFRITITPSGGNLRFKTSSPGPAAQPLSNAKFSVSGSFSAIPEPGAFLFGGLAVAFVGATRFVRTTRRR
jgi:hypothetical protein